MASGNHISCGPCMFDDVTKDAVKWCTSCEEGLCEDCENVHRKGKTTRSHKVISIDDYSKIEHVSISQVCEHHGENLEWFCKSHDEVLCVVCVPSKHKACSDVIPISVNSANARQSSALSDLEETIEGTLRNFKQCIKNRESASNELEKQELTVKTMILETRTKINVHLDKLQEKLLYELRSTSITCKSKYWKIIQTLKSKEEMLTKLKEQIIHMKQFSSDIQVFLGTHQINKRIVHEVEHIKSEIGAAKDYELKVSIHSLIEKLDNDVEEFGGIKVSECVAKLDFRDPKIDQAQIGFDVMTPRNISSIKLEVIKTFQIKDTNKTNVKSCVLLPNGNFLITKVKKEQLMEYSDAGKHIRDIPVSGMPYYLALIDQNRIVVTYEGAKFLEILNNKTFTVEKKISLEYNCSGISHVDGRLYVISGCNTVKVQDLLGNQLETLTLASKGISCIKTSSEKIFYADYDTNQVHCCRLNGEELWKYKCESTNFPDDITEDCYHNVYVVGYISNNLTIIQHDGRESKTLLTESEGLNHPVAVDFDTKKRTLLICNKGGHIALYKVI